MEITEAPLDEGPRVLNDEALRGLCAKYREQSNGNHNNLGTPHVATPAVG